MTWGNQKVRLLIVDDSPQIQSYLRTKLLKFGDIDVVGTASNPTEARSLMKLYNPDVMTLDIQMGEENGVDYLREVMSSSPMPVIMVTDLSLKHASPVAEALSLGAFDYVQKPDGKNNEQFLNRLHELIVYAKKANKLVSYYRDLNTHSQELRSTAFTTKINPFNIVTLGASTGGPSALQLIFSNLRKPTPPIAVVIHMAQHFTKKFAESLNNESELDVKEAEHDEAPKDSTVYIAPGGKHLKMNVDSKGNYRFVLSNEDLHNSFKPSVNVFFQSLAEHRASSGALAILMTGMGDDGATGLLKLKNIGAITVAQNEATSTVFGMPKAAIEIGAANEILSIQQIIKRIQNF